jgi:hypothetical protein
VNNQALILNKAPRKEKNKGQEQEKETGNEPGQLCVLSRFISTACMVINRMEKVCIKKRERTYRGYNEGTSLQCGLGDDNAFDTT